jgi:molybdenum cofactor biosynthesis enzyme MoaA
MWLDIQDESQIMPASVASIPAATLQDDNDPLLRPTVQELASEIETHYNEHDYTSIVIAGEGEPTLRMCALQQLARRIQQLHPNVPLRVTTNGLVGMRNDSQNDCDNTAASLKDCGVHSVSVAIMTHDADQYNQLMEPISSTSKSAHACVVNFMKSAIRVGLSVEATAIDRPDVDKVKTTEFVSSIGVDTLRWRTYFP